MSYLKPALIALFASVLPSALPATASADQPACPPEQSGGFETISPRTNVPVGYRAARTFGVHNFSTANATLQLTAPADYLPVPFTRKSTTGGDAQLGLFITAPRPGPFVVQGSWTNSSGSGPCTATGVVTLTAVNPTPLKIKLPKRKVGSSAKKPEYDKLEWTWRCTDATVAPPLEATLRYQLKKRGKLSRKAKRLTIVAQDPCDYEQDAGVVKKTPRGVNLNFSAGAFDLSSGAVSLTLAGRFKGRFPVMHVGVVIKQGSSRFVSRAYCAIFTNDIVNETRNCRVPGT